jgi:uncharacterized protein YdaU (DUF1376 family)
MSERPWMPFFPTDFIGDTTHLTVTEVGQYLLLLMAMWNNDGELPNDPKRLARMARSRAVSPEVMDFFDHDGAGNITQKRLLKELDRAKQLSQRQSSIAKKRWAKEANPLESNEPADATAYAAPMPPQPQPQPHRSQSNITTSSTPIDAEFRDEFWPAYPHKVGKPHALRAFMAARKRADLATILGGLKLYVETRPPDRPWLNPSTFLNQDRYLDAPAPISHKRSKVAEVARRMMKEAIDEDDNETGSNFCGQHVGGIISVPAARARSVLGAAGHHPDWATNGHREDALPPCRWAYPNLEGPAYDQGCDDLDGEAADVGGTHQVSTTRIR